MKNIILISLLFLLSGFALDDDIKTRGIALVQYNAKFNESNSYNDINKVRDVKLLNLWIDDDASIKTDEGIRSVPTMILYKNGKEIKRWEAGLSLSLDVPYLEIQNEVDKLTGANKF